MIRRHSKESNVLATTLRYFYRTGVGIAKVDKRMLKYICNLSGSTRSTNDISNKSIQKPPGRSTQPRNRNTQTEAKELQVHNLNLTMNSRWKAYRDGTNIRQKCSIYCITRNGASSQADDKAMSLLGLQLKRNDGLLQRGSNRKGRTWLAMCATCSPKRTTTRSQTAFMKHNEVVMMHYCLTNVSLN